MSYKNPFICNLDSVINEENYFLPYFFNALQVDITPCICCINGLSDPQQWLFFLKNSHFLFLPNLWTILCLFFMKCLILWGVRIQNPQRVQLWSTSVVFIFHFDKVCSLICDCKVSYFSYCNKKKMVNIYVEFYNTLSISVSCQYHFLFPYVLC